PQPKRTASGSRSVGQQPAKVAKASRIWVEGVHDAELVEKIWGDDLRIEGIVVEPLHGIDDLDGAVKKFKLGQNRRLAVLFANHRIPIRYGKKITASAEQTASRTVRSPSFWGQRRVHCRRGHAGSRSQR